MAQVVRFFFTPVVFFLNKKKKDRPPLIVVIINPEIYKQNKAAFDKAGFEEITAENAYYFNKGKAKAE